MTTLVVIAKDCVPGRVKTRLHPPLTFEQAASVAEASLDDTLRSLDTVPATRRIFFFDGDSPPLLAAGYELVPQPAGSLDERIADIFDQVSGPAVLVGMDTPQLTHDMVAPAFDDWPSDVDAWFGPATDGGFWALGLAEPDGDLIRGVPMSREDTGKHQLHRLHHAGLRVALLPELTDIDTIDDLIAVGTSAPQTATSRMLRSLVPALTLPVLR